MKKSVFVTHSHADSKDTFQYIISQLEQHGLDVKYDEKSLQYGVSLWDQIEHHIKETDALCFVVTDNSINSPACREELNWALKRAIERKYKIVGIFASEVDTDLVPSAITSRLYASLKNEKWAEELAKSLKGEAAGSVPSPMGSHFLKIHSINPEQFGGSRFALEMRPRAGTWAPFICMYPLDEQSRVQSSLRYGPQGSPDSIQPYMMGTMDGTAKNLHFHGASHEATPTMSYYLLCADLPKFIDFGRYAPGQQLMRASLSA